MTKIVELPWTHCIDENDDPGLIAYTRGYVCLVTHNGLRWAIVQMKTGGIVSQGTNPPGVISIHRTASHVNRRFATMLSLLG